MRYLLVACEVLLRELADAVAHSPHIVDVDFQPKGLHDSGCVRMLQTLQAAVDRAEPSRHDAVLLGYALCGNGLHGLKARGVPLVAPRAHDCIALLMGSRQRYARHFAENSGVFYRSTGWVERGRGMEQLGVDGEAGITLDDLIARYGEDNGRYLYDEIARVRRVYRKLTFIETGLEPDETCAQSARAEAAESGWAFAKIPGDLRLFRALVAGDWDPADFLVVEPGYRIVASYDDGVIRAERIPS